MTQFQDGVDLDMHQEAIEAMGPVPQVPVTRGRGAVGPESGILVRSRCLAYGGQQPLSYF
jgi:hypothetical protein